MSSRMHVTETMQCSIHFVVLITSVELQSLQVENLKMRDTIRQMLSQTQGMEVAFELYESDILRLEAQVFCALTSGISCTASSFLLLRSVSANLFIERICDLQVHDLQVGKFNVQSEFTTLRIHNQELQKSKRQVRITF